MLLNDISSQLHCSSKLSAANSELIWKNAPLSDLLSLADCTFIVLGNHVIDMLFHNLVVHGFLHSHSV